MYISDGGSDLDLDAILGDLCELESQLTTQRTEISDLQRKTSTSSNPDTKKEAEEDFTWDDAIDDQLQNALSVLNDIAGISFETNELESSLGAKSNNNNNLDFSSEGHSDQGQGDQVSCDSQGNTVLTPSSDQVPVTVDTTNKDLSLDNQKSHDLSPDDTDSAFSDNVSLPSSGSHASVTTTTSGNSGGTSGVSSGLGGGDPSVPVSTFCTSFKTFYFRYRE